MKQLLAVLAGLLIAAVATAQEGTLAFVGARVLPVSGPAIDDGVVIVSGGRITAVGGSDLSIPDGATRVDCTGAVITPGLIDAGTHLGLLPRDLNEHGQEVTPQVKVKDAFDPGDAALRRALLWRRWASRHPNPQRRSSRLPLRGSVKKKIRHCLQRFRQPRRSGRSRSSDRILA